MKRYQKILLSLFIIFNVAYVANKVIKKDHAHDEKEERHHEEKHEDEHKDEHKDENKDEHKDGHGEHGEEGNDAHGEGNSRIGPEKGILKADEQEGFALSPEATKNFGLQYLKLEGNAPWKVPFNARMLSQEEVNLYRVRSSNIKRIDFKLISREGNNMIISSKDLVAGDQIVTTGIGFLRIAEIAAYGGAPEGHAH